MGALRVLVAVLCASLTLPVAALAQAKPRAEAKSKAEAKPKPDAKSAPAAETRADAHDRAVWVGPVLGLAIPFSGGGPGYRIGAGGSLYNLGAKVNVDGITVGGLISLAILPPPPPSVVGAGTTVGVEIAPALLYRRPLPFARMALRGTVALGFSHRRTVEQIAHFGYTVRADNAFMGRLAVGASYHLADRIHLYLEPLQIALYAGANATAEYTVSLGAGYAL